MSIRLAIEITDWADLLTLKDLLNGEGLIQMKEPQDVAPQPEKEPEVAQEKKAATRKAGNGKSAEKPKEEQTAAAGPSEPETGPIEPDEATAGAVDPSNPFADDVIETKKPKKLTRDDVNVAFKQYIDVYGQAAAMQDVTALLSETFGVKAIRDIPNTQDAFTKAILAVADAIEGNRFERAKI